MSADDEGGLDLSGDGDGIYSYSVPLPPVPFTAKLIERGSSLAGTIEEESVMGADRRRRRRTASVEGRRASLAVIFLKRYQDRAIRHDVEYDGTSSADGAEVSGRWSIFGDGSGPFLMVRRPRKALARTRQAEAGIS